MIIELKDEWFFTKENNPCYSREKMIDGEVLSLPHTWNGADGQCGGKGCYRGACWYQRNLFVDSETLDKNIFMEIGAASLVSAVYINGMLAVESRCGYAMFRANITPFLRIGGNLISIMVDNSHHEDVYPLMADFTFYGGLYRYVKLIQAESLHFDLLDKGRDGIYLTQTKTGVCTFELKINGTVVNESSETKEAKLMLALLDQEKNKVTDQVIPVKCDDRFEFEITKEIQDVIVWQGIENPYLYTLKAELLFEDKVLDEREIKIGFRHIEISSEHGMLLNGEPIKLNGVSRHQDFAGIGNALDKEHMELDIALIKEVGANSIRLSHYQQDDYFYSLCDQEGFLVWAEIPFISVPAVKDKSNQNAKVQLERLIKQVYNHSSVYCWGVQNEITIAAENEAIYSLVRELAALAKELDPGRLNAQANMYSVADQSPLNEMTDIIGYNLYYGWYYKEIKDLGIRLDEFHAARPELPVVVSEYGVDTNPKIHSYHPAIKDYSEEYQLLFHDNAIRSINERRFVLGGYQWNMFDFGSHARNEGGDTGKNLKGLITIDRKIKKDAFYLYKANWSNIPFVHLAGKRFVNRHEALNEVVVLSNLEKVVLYHFDECVGEIISSAPLKRFSDIPLIPGDNLIKAMGYDKLGNVFVDEMVLRYGEMMDKSYVLEKREEKKHVTNWFEKFDLSNVEEVILKDGYYSTFDTIKDLFDNEEAKAVFEKYFGNTAESPRFQSMMEITTIEGMSKVSFFGIPKELLPVINKDLNRIPKNKGGAFH